MLQRSEHHNRCHGEVSRQLLRQGRHLQVRFLGDSVISLPFPNFLLLLPPWIKTFQIR